MQQRILRIFLPATWVVFAADPLCLVLVPVLFAALSQVRVIFQRTLRHVGRRIGSETKQSQWEQSQLGGEAIKVCKQSEGEKRKREEEKEEGEEKKRKKSEREKGIPLCVCSKTSCSLSMWADACCRRSSRVEASLNATSLSTMVEASFSRSPLTSLFDCWFSSFSNRWTFLSRSSFSRSSARKSSSV